MGFQSPLPLPSSTPKGDQRPHQGANSWSSCQNPYSWTDKLAQGLFCPAELPAQKIKAEIGPFIKTSRIVLPPLREIERKSKAFGYLLLDKRAIGKESLSPYLFFLSPWIDFNSLKISSQSGKIQEQMTKMLRTQNSTFSHRDNFPSFVYYFWNTGAHTHTHTHTHTHRLGDQ